MSDPQYQVDLGRTANVPVTEGVHPFKLTAGEEGEGPKGPYWKFTASCLTPGEEGKTCMMIVSLSPQARWRLEIFLDALGAPLKGGATIDKFIGRTFRGQVSHELYEGRPQARIGEMWPMSAAATPKPAAPAPTPVVVKSIGGTPTVVAEQPPLPTPVPMPAEAPAVDTGKGLPADATEAPYEPPFPA